MFSSQSGDKSFAPPAAGPLGDRVLLLREIQQARQDNIPERMIFLIVVNFADTKNYDEIIRVFGYKFADDLLHIRLADLEFITRQQMACRVGVWSAGFIFRGRTPKDYEAALEQLSDILAKPVICRGIPVIIRAGIGICDLAKGLGAAEDLLQATYLAGQAAADSADSAGWAECQYDDLEADHRRAFTLISDAENSLATPNEFSLRYQARINLKTGGSDAVEAFLRWRHPTLGIITPDEFIPLIEATGLIRQLTFWVLSNTIAQASKWHVMGYPTKICIKISAKNLSELDFYDRLKALLEAYHLDPALLELQFSERRHISDIANARDRLIKLREIGVNISVDDFGTGASSFTSLEQFPANAIKIDRRLIHSVVDHPRQQALVRSIIRMAHELGMYAVAEGVETQAILELLIAWHCDYAEGYLINRPMPADSFTEWYCSRFARRPAA
jgi:EAL domain-containing protein (putative c-di-GMP-specific phosphodiesterase class I)